MYFQSTEEHVNIILCLQFVHIHSVFKEINALTCSANAVEYSFPNNPWVSCSFSMYSNTSAYFSEYVGSFTHLYAMYAIAASAKCIVICIKHCSRLICLLEYFGQSTPYSNIALITKYVEALQRELVETYLKRTNSSKTLTTEQMVLPFCMYHKPLKYCTQNG